MNINIDSVATDITQVTVDGNTDIQKINVDGTDVWFKAPTALEVVTALVADVSLSSTNRNWTTDQTFLKFHPMTQDNWSTKNLTDTVSTTGLTAPITTSPYVTLIGITSGTEGSSGTFGSQFYTPTGGSETGATENTEVNYTANYGMMRIRTSYVNTSLSDLDSYKIQQAGSGNDWPQKPVTMILPNKWNATKVSADGAGSYSLGSGEIIIITNLDSGPDSYDSANYVGTTVTPGSNSVVLQNEWWWYKNGSIGIYANTTSSSKTISWTDTGAYVRVMKLTQQGI